MTRISLKEAYDNRDVVGQIARLTDEVNEHTEILDNLPNPDLTNCVIKDTDQIITGEKTFTKVIHAEGGIEVNTSGGFEIDGALTVNGDIIQNGQAYETHAEQVFSQNDLIVTRDGAVSSLPSGGVSGVQVKKYNGVNDGRLVMDNTGTARVGDVGDEQPLMTRDEAGDMIGGGLLKWDAVHSKAVSSPMDNAPTSGSINAVTSGGVKTAIDGTQANIDALGSVVAGKVSGSGNIGSDVKPVKIVNGTATPISGNLEYIPGDTIAFEANATMGFGYVNFNQLSQCIIPLSKPISSAVTSITITDNNPNVRCDGEWSELTNVALSKHPLGVYIRGNTTFTGKAEKACAIRASGSGTTIRFN